ncbi:hypothetical protein TVAG_210300 [Trichomonas vaginalis G3]|uniref:Uncharacterized protein n=1 Tax=Trichomonas vaginalis (strain ATCC PRA-98 / G3) TaxID=412133 RepID=A2DVT7_TRIV3|nr:hypothetical protein TVAGG3_0734850 [Trichomonas vaginalis G3]EAY15500.1 hypothetical protein TVAG_210300 [Trichomonas vaginalis G3]KAI5511511.1 hypothetical protein TVAGG3_0734850 [Trichomonas vaginalis G3]|eukprot:XP_001327723.1 hypothetical protein [Trichomonas vaginalis G3]
MRVKTQLKRGKSLYGKNLKEIIVAAGRIPLSSDKKEEESTTDQESISIKEKVPKINSSGNIRLNLNFDSSDSGLSLSSFHSRRRNRRKGLAASQQFFNLDLNNPKITRNNSDVFNNLIHQDVSRELPLPPISEDHEEERIPLNHSTITTEELDTNSGLIPLGASGDYNISNTELVFQLNANVSDISGDEMPLASIIKIPSAGIFASDTSDDNTTSQQPSVPPSPKTPSSLSMTSDMDVFMRFKRNGIDTKQNELLDRDMFSDDSDSVKVEKKQNTISRFMLEPEFTQEDTERLRLRNKHHKRFTAMMSMYKKKHRKLKSSVVNNDEDEENVKKKGKKHHHHEEPEIFKDDEDAPPSPKPNKLRRDHNYGHHKYLKNIY